MKITVSKTFLVEKCSKRRVTRKDSTHIMSKTNLYIKSIKSSFQLFYISFILFLTISVISNLKGEKRDENSN